MLTQTQRDAAMAIVNIFETGTVRGDYGNVTVAAGDPGHLTFGRSQTTLATQNGAGLLGRLVDDYCATPGARWARLLQPYTARMHAADLSLDTDGRLKNLLRATADDLVMRDTQDVFFGRRYWDPAVQRATALGLVRPLSVAVVYDSTVHGSFDTVRQLADNAAGGTAVQVGEVPWVKTYVATRHQWLATHPTIPLLHATAYRMEAFQRLIDFDLWDLPLPLLVRGSEINLATLAAMPANSFDGPMPGTRALAVQGQVMRGLDVRLFQVGLSEAGIDIVADGLFGFGSRNALRGYRQRQGLPAGDVADAALVMALAQSVS